MVERRHVVALLKLELVRQRKFTLRLFGSTLFMGAVFCLLGQHGASSLLAVSLGAGIVMALIVPAGASRDKVEGTLEFLAALPTPPAAIATARLVAVVLTTLPWAVLTAAATPFALTMAHAHPVAATAVGALLGAWLLYTLIGWVGTGLFLRYEPRRFLGYPLAVLLLAVVFLPKYVRLQIPAESAARLTWFVAQPWAPAVVALALVLLGGAVLAASLRLAVRGIELYRPDPTAR